MIFAALIAGAFVVGGTDGFAASSSSFSGGNMLHHAPRSSQALSMVSTPPTPSTASTSSAPLTQDQFNTYVQNTYGRYPLTIVRGEGCKLFDSDGKEYLDFVAGISTCALGHADPDLAAAVGDQMKKFHHVSNLYYIPEQGQLAKWLVDNSCTDRVFFCNSGAEANEAGIKLARKHANTKLGIAEPVIVTAKKSFHGRTLATMTATGQPNYQKNFGPLVPGFEYATYNDPEDLKRVVKRINRRGKIRSLFGRPRRAVAAIMMEALQGEGGVVPATPEFFSTVRELCDETGALMIVDEVQTGMGRTGKVWGYQNFDVEPDVVTCAKALGGGVPIGAMLCKERADVFEPGNHASTFGGNPLACAAANCVTSKLSENRGALLENVRERGEQLRAGLAGLQEKYPKTVAGVRGWGLINGLVLKEESPVLAGAVVAETTKLGLLLVPAGLKVVRFVPPLVATAAEVSTALSVIDQALAIVTCAK
ncbi:unnamed protein product [Ectocarpus sp. CCAP 1310/34]|nr:unnamed protein product [Ectocarpus sp. CCAP 1310/34]